MLPPHFRDVYYNSDKYSSNSSFLMRSPTVHISNHLSTMQILRTGLSGDVSTELITVSLAGSRSVVTVTSRLSNETSSSSLTGTSSDVVTKTRASSSFLPSATSSGQSTSSTFLQVGPSTSPPNAVVPLITATFPEPTPSTPAVLSKSSTTRAIVTQMRKPTIDPSATPKFPVWIGRAISDTFRRSIGFVDTGSSDSACHYATLLDDVDENPCGLPWQGADGLKYVWNGCGGQTWVTWINPASGSSRFQFLGNCTWKPETWGQCGEVEDTTISLGWLCQP